MPCSDKGQVEAAIAEYKQAIQTRPEVRHGPQQPGQCPACQGPVGRGHRRVQAGHHTRPEGRPAHYNLGNALGAKGQVDEAIAEYKQAITLDPKDALAHYNLGLALRDKGQLDEAIAEYKQAITLDPKYARAHYNLGLALKAKGQLDEAIAEYKQAITLDPKTPGPQQPGHCPACQGPVGRGHRRVQAGHHTRPEARPGPLQPGDGLSQQKKYPEAIACARAAIAADPKLANAHAMLGDLLYGRATSPVRGRRGPRPPGSTSAGRGCWRSCRRWRSPRRRGR